MTFKAKHLYQKRERYGILKIQYQTTDVQWHNDYEIIMYRKYVQRKSVKKEGEGEKEGQTSSEADR